MILRVEVSFCQSLHVLMAEVGCHGLVSKQLRSIGVTWFPGSERVCDVRTFSSSSTPAAPRVVDAPSPAALRPSKAGCGGRLVIWQITTDAGPDQVGMRRDVHMDLVAEVAESQTKGVVTVLADLNCMLHQGHLTHAYTCVVIDRLLLRANRASMTRRRRRYSGHGSRRLGG